jgi:hypothetical protein
MSHREIKVMSGHLKGMGREAKCLVSAVQVSMPGTNVSHYAKCKIQNAPDDLPEGSYQVTFDGQTENVKKSNGFWLADARF